MSLMIIGTNHFFSRRSAILYYSDYEENPEKIVDAKIAAGEIVIGEPRLNKGESLICNFKEGRYFIKAGQDVSESAKR